MELLVILVLFALFVLFMLMIPVVLLLGLFGLAFQSIDDILLFSLKYLLPFGITGFILAKIRARAIYFSIWRYLKYIALALGIGFVVLLIFLKIPVTLEFPEADSVKQVTVSYETSYGTEITQTESNEQIWKLMKYLNRTNYSRTLTEFMEDSEDNREYTLILTDTEGTDYTIMFYSQKVLGIKKHGITWYYKPKEHYVPVSWAENQFTLERRAKKEAVWGPFAEELFSTIVYDEENEVITFTIPETIPEGSYDILLSIEGARGYTDGEFEPWRITAYGDEQENDTWEPGKQYTLPLEDICFSRCEITVTAVYLEDGYTFDILPLLPEDRVHRE